jgi:hypothetical protein
MALTPAEKLLKDLGITEPKDIDLEAIAWHCGAIVKYRPLRGCEARIVGSGSRAVISIHTEGTNTRKRYSLAHELGHWDTIEDNPLSADQTTSMADMQRPLSSG